MANQSGIVDSAVEEADLAGAWDATFDEIANVIVKQWWRQGSIQRTRFTATSVCVVVFVLAAIHYREDSNLLDWTFVGVGVGFCSLVWFSGPWRYERQARRTVRRNYKGEVPVRCETQFKPDGIHVRSQHQSGIYEWPCVEEVRHDDEGVDFLLTNGWYWVPSRAFHDADHMFRCIQYATQQMDKANLALPN